MKRALCFAAMLIFLVSPFLPRAAAAQAWPYVYVPRVVDGDTIKVKLNGREESVRLIGVDTPETVKPHTPVQPYGLAASSFTKKSLTGKQVYLEFDVQERDKYGRLLAYVWLARPAGVSEREIRAKQFNARLLLEGYAQVMTVPPNVKYAEMYVKFGREARQAGKGLWGLSSAQIPAPAVKLSLHRLAAKMKLSFILRIPEQDTTKPDAGI